MPSGNGYAILAESGNIPIFAHNTSAATAAYLASPCCAADLYGDVAVHGNLSFSGNLSGGNKAGYVSDVALNAGTTPLESGGGRRLVPSAEDIPVAKVVKATKVYQGGVVGVVDQHLVLAGENNLRYQKESVPVGEYLNVVTLGMFRAVKADASFGPIRPGDLLLASVHAGYAMKAADRLQALGATNGKALDGLDSGNGVVPVIVTLH